MWSCPKCETLNDEGACFICGEIKPSPTATATSGSTSSTIKEKKTTSVSSAEKKTGAWFKMAILWILIILLTVVLGIILGNLYNEITYAETASELPGTDYILRLLSNEIFAS